MNLIIVGVLFQLLAPTLLAKNYEQAYNAAKAKYDQSIKDYNAADAKNKQSASRKAAWAGVMSAQAKLKLYEKSGKPESEINEAKQELENAKANFKQAQLGKWDWIKKHKWSIGGGLAAVGAVGGAAWYKLRDHGTSVAENEGPGITWPNVMVPNQHKFAKPVDTTGDDNVLYLIIGVLLVTLIILGLCLYFTMSPDDSDDDAMDRQGRRRRSSRRRGSRKRKGSRRRR